MGAAFRAEPPELHAVAPSFTAAGGDLEAALAALRSTLGGLGDICGHDEQGCSFAAGLATITDGLGAMAGNYQASDQAAATNFRRIGGGR